VHEGYHTLDTTRLNAADQMHYMAVFLHPHQVRHLDRPITADAAQVIPSQIHQHDMFGTFLGIGEQFSRQKSILCRRLAARTSARNWPILHPPLVTFTSISAMPAR